MMKNKVLFLLPLLLMGCRSVQYVPVVTTQTDTLMITKHERDSIWLQDSTHVHEYQRHDTLYMEVQKWRTKYIERQTHDTIYQATHDTIPQPYPVEVKVEKNLTWWQQLRIHLGNALLILMAAAGAWGIIKWRFKL